VRVEIIERDDNSRDGLVQIAFADTREEAALIRGLLRNEGIRSLAKQTSINGPSLGTGMLTRSSRRIYVVPADAEAARTLLGETMVEEPPEEEIPESANEAYLAEATGGHKPRNYSTLGAFARAYIACAVVIAIFVVLFIFLH
jgi:hypothetical protein